ncbi:MAG: hypothetical protein RMJ14_05260 [Nitrososphaerota archaeon]|nr:hypothetical protein [Aigarchaeota archaeon]MDW8077026.1 hypothetical protein [Nitrososphaerota archaeon]
MLGVIARLSGRIWSEKTVDEVLSRRFKLFVLLGIFFTGIFWVYRTVAGIEFLPNLEWVIPTLVTVGSFSLPLGGGTFWRALNRYFGVLALAGVVAFDLIFFGPELWHVWVFKWSGLTFAWLLGMRNRLSMFDRYKRLLGSTLLTTAMAILLFDFWTGVIGCGLWIGSLWLSFIGQIPFTLYHLASLIFVPPLVALAKLLVKVKVPVALAARSRLGVASGEVWR